MEYEFYKDKIGTTGSAVIVNSIADAEAISSYPVTSAYPYENFTYFHSAYPYHKYAVYYNKCAVYTYKNLSLQTAIF